MLQLLAQPPGLFALVGRCGSSSRLVAQRCSDRHSLLQRIKEPLNSGKDLYTSNFDKSARSVSLSASIIYGKPLNLFSSE